VQLFIDILRMRLDRIHRNEKQFTDLSIALSGNEMTDDLYFTLRHPVQGMKIDERSIRFFGFFCGTEGVESVEERYDGVDDIVGGKKQAVY